MVQNFKYDEKELMEKILKDGNKFPISSSNINLKDKKVDYKVLMLLTLLSNRNTDEMIEESGEEDSWRYIYRNKLTHYKDLVESLSNTKLNSIFKTIKKMEKLDCKVIDVRKTNNNDIVYDINYATNGREFVTIETRIMQSLINTCNSNTIKIYVILKFMCRYGKKKITREWLLNQIGLSNRSSNNYQKLADITDILHLGGYINKETRYISCDKSINYYSINSIEEWKELRKERLKHKS